MRKVNEMTMRRLLFGVLALVGMIYAGGAHAQNPIKITTCGTASPPAGASNPYMDATGDLCVAATVLATATTTATASATPTTVSAGPNAPLNINLSSALFEQPTFAGTPVDGTHGLPVNCIVGCAGGTASNASSGVATSSTNGTTNAWLYGFNGTSWDQLQVDGSKFLKVIAQAGSAIIGKVGIDQTTPGTTNGAAVVGINAATALAGAGATGPGSLRVTAAQDATTIAGAAPGTAGSASTNVVTVQGIASMTPILSNPGTAANWGVGATGSAAPANGVYNTGDAQSAEPAKATTGNLIGAFYDLTGKTVTSPYANREAMVRGSASATGTGATTLIAAGGASIKTYITDVECGRSDAGTSAIIVTFSDAAATILVLPNSGGGGGNNKTFNVPLVTAANTAFTFTAGTGATTVYCSAQGFSGY